MLEAVSVEGMASALAKHWHHLLGMALYLDGDIEAAGRHWEAGLPLDGECELEPYLELVSPFPEPLRPEDWGPDQTIVRQLRGAIQTADLLLAEGHWQAVIRTLASARTETSSSGMGLLPFELPTGRKVHHAALRLLGHGGVNRDPWRRVL